ncbi:DUF2959 domain-containing protein [Pontibacterium granulatum]|uniref:DUF2959 domain-containing protein n=1 Tax=Pontibacterium granulatum TaxID=2036029 RepID=UPI00249B3AAC|nr:DUF2959 domain-containing protein [Pontibacterium granulatum]MDI3323755.1 DUF2959 domain-containing protein [Pontibacterium granulatum]
MKLTFRALLGAGLLVLLTGCQTAYYSAMEQVGVHKRDILVDRVADVRDSQTDAQEQFKDALEQFRSVVQFDGGDLDKMYNSLQAEYDDSVDAADDVRNRIEKVETVAEDLFEEWNEELGKYKSRDLRNQSARKLRETRQRYSELLRSLKRAEKRMEPVLATLQDNVLYLKHNLNARAIGALKGEFRGMQQDIELLMRDMQRAIKESDSFIKSMDNQA